MLTNPIADKVNEPVATSLEYTLTRLRDVLRVPQNADVATRRFTVDGFACALIYLDSMINQQLLNHNVMEPSLLSSGYDGEPAGRVDWLVSRVLSASAVCVKEQIDDVVAGILMGNAAMLVDGCPLAIVIEAKGYSRRSSKEPMNERNIVGPHDAFVESTKINLSLIRRSLQSPRLVSEIHEVGNGVPNLLTMVYMDGVTNEQIITEFRRRLSNLDIDYISNIGELEQLIEDSPYALLPQFIHTERPDRAISFLVSGQVLLFFEGCPTALAAPTTLLHLMHTPDSQLIRFPYANFRRLIMMIGFITMALLPSAFLAIVMFHNEVLPLALMTSIYETQSRVPFPIFYEMLFLNIGFDLILEACMRMPGVLTSSIGIVSALILGQAVVAADLVSPILIVIVALSSLGSLVVPEYSLSVCLRMFQYVTIIVAAVGGLFGLLLVLTLGGIELCSMTSMGVPFTWVSTPGRMHNPDKIMRYPIWQQRIRMYLSNPGQMLRSYGRMRAWDSKEKPDGK